MPVYAYSIESDFNALKAFCYTIVSRLLMSGRWSFMNEEKKNNTKKTDFRKKKKMPQKRLVVKFGRFSIWIMKKKLIRVS